MDSFRKRLGIICSLHRFEWSPRLLKENKSYSQESEKKLNQKRTILNPNHSFAGQLAYVQINPSTHTHWNNFCPPISLNFPFLFKFQVYVFDWLWTKKSKLGDQNEILFTISPGIPFKIILQVCVSVWSNFKYISPFFPRLIPVDLLFEFCFQRKFFSFSASKLDKMASKKGKNHNLRICHLHC